MSAMKYTFNLLTSKIQRVGVLSKTRPREFLRKIGPRGALK
jgi:hypothetical protein